MSLDNLKRYDVGSKIAMAVRIGEYRGNKNGSTLGEVKEILKKIGTELTEKEIEKLQEGLTSLRYGNRYVGKGKHIRTLGIEQFSEDTIDIMLIQCGILEGRKLKMNF